MIGKVIAASAAGAYGFSKLSGMESDDIRSIGEKVSTAVQSFAENAQKTAGKEGFIKNVLDAVKSTSVGSMFVGGAAKAASAGINGISTGAHAFFNAMAQAKESADKGEGTFLGNAAKGMAKEAVGIGKQALSGLTGAIASGAAYISEKAGTEYAATPCVMPQAESQAEAVQADASADMECGM